MAGNYRDIHKFNREHTEWYNDKVLSFVRWSDDEQLIIVSNFSDTDTFGFELQLPKNLVDQLQLKESNYEVKDQDYKLRPV